LKLIILLILQDNIHAMRSSFEKFIDLMYSDTRDDGYFSKLEATGWINWIKVLLESAVRIGDFLENEGATVIVHCSGRQYFYFFDIF
jgi:myotubularin-related protein 1/2